MEPTPVDGVRFPPAVESDHLIPSTVPQLSQRTPRANLYTHAPPVEDCVSLASDLFRTILCMIS
jgi:hypothetical protein